MAELNTVKLVVKLATKEMSGTLKVPAKVIGITSVESVNGQTGDVILNAQQVGAISNTDILTNSDILTIWNSV